MADFRDYKYIGMPFHAVGFPQPVYSHLMGSNDGINWTDLKAYNFGWRDTDIAYINGEFWTCTGTYVNRTTDFETFTQVQCPNMGLKNLWASEFFQDNNDNWWFIYCGSETDVDYSEFKLYASRFYPERHQIDAVRHDITLNASGGYIDPNINYINGYYYLWCSKTSTPTQELHLFKSSNVLGPYEEIQTNIMSLTNSAGYTWNEAPEMVVVNGKYYLYSDPWNRGASESDRNVYRAESDDLVTWTNMERCNADVTMRHFTPLIITPYLNQIPDNTDHTVNHPEIPNLDSSKINLWSGNPSTLFRTNMSNFEYIQSWINAWNNSKNDNLVHIETKLDLTKLEFNNRKAYSQFTNNANEINQLLMKLIEIYNFTGNEYQLNIPDVSNTIILDKDVINDYWSAVQNGINHINEELKCLG